MTLGTGIFLSTLIVSILLLYKWTRERWDWARGFKRFFVFLVAISAITGLGFWGYDAYENRVVKQTEYYGIKLGMSMDEVLYIKGEPSINVTLQSDDALMRMYKNTKNKSEKPDIRLANVWSYGGDSLGFSGEVSVTFHDKSQKVQSISCSSEQNYYSACEDIAGIHLGSSEQFLFEKLKEPSESTLIDRVKSLEYHSLNLSFGLEKQEVAGISVVDFSSKNSPHLQK